LPPKTEFLYECIVNEPHIVPIDGKGQTRIAAIISIGLIMQYVMEN